MTDTLRRLAEQLHYVDITTVSLHAPRMADILVEAVYLVVTEDEYVTKAGVAEITRVYALTDKGADEKR